MALATKWRNLLAALLVFAVSPFSACAQIACNVTCAFHWAGTRAYGLDSPQSKEVSTASARQSAHMHCHDHEDSSGPHCNDFRSGNGSCRRDACASPESDAARVIAKADLSAHRTEVIDYGVSIHRASAISLATSDPLRPRARNSSTGFHDVLSASGTLRI